MPLAPRLTRRASLLIGAFSALAFATGCKKAAADTTGVSETTPDVVMIVQGSDQTAQAGKDLPTPIILRVLNKAGNAIPHVTVALSIGTGGGSVSPSSDSTDSKGEIKAKWTLGPGVVDQAILVMVPGLSPLPVRATGILPSTIVLVQGNFQSAKVGATLTNSIVVRVIGGANVPMAGVTVGFQVLTGGGAMVPQTVVTNALGEATTKWSVGTAGANTALVTALALAPVNLTATVTP